MGGYSLFLNTSVNLARGFWIGKPCASDNTPFFEVPSFWSFAGKLIRALLTTDRPPECHDIRKRIGEVTSTPSVMAEVVKKEMIIRPI